MMHGSENMIGMVCIYPVQMKCVDLFVCFYIALLVDLRL